MSQPPAADLARTAAELPFTRLIHFTPARSLVHILRDRQLRSSSDLAALAPEQFSPTDNERFDQHPDHVCCTFEYPNDYYLDKASKKPEHVNYPHWVILTLAKDLVLRPGALFSGCNAAKGGGAYLRPGAQALADCWADPSIPQRYRRGAPHLVTTPTDLQAEVLIPGPISLSDVTGIIVSSAEVAEEQAAFLRRLTLNTEHLTWKVAPVLFDKYALTRAIHRGVIPDETPWVSTEGDRW